MLSRQRTIDFLAAACIVVAFGGLFIGRLMIHAVSTAEGTFLQQVAAKDQAWDVGHRSMLVGIIGVIAAAIALRRATWARSPWIADAAATLTIVGATLSVGQYALDFAMLAAARVEPPDAGAQFLTALQADSFVQWAFYRLPEVSQLGLVAFTIALWRQGTPWRLPAALVTLAAVVSIAGEQLFGSTGVHLTLGLLFLGFSTVAWRIAVCPPQPNIPPH